MKTLISLKNINKNHLYLSILIIGSEKVIYSIGQIPKDIFNNFRCDKIRGIKKGQHSVKCLIEEIDI
jgi:hypothetical protein